MTSRETALRLLEWPQWVHVTWFQSRYAHACSTIYGVVTPPSRGMLPVYKPDPRGGRPWLTFRNQVSLKSHDIFNLKAILHVIDDNEPLSIANAIEKELKISPVFPWPITSKTDLQGRKLLLVLIFEFSPHNCEAFGGSRGKKSAVSEEQTGTTQE